MQVQKYTLEDVKEAMIKKIKELDESLTIEDKGNILEVKKEKDKLSMGIGLENILQQLNLGENPEMIYDTRMEIVKNFLNQEKIIKDMETWSFVKDKIIFVPTQKDYCMRLAKGSGMIKKPVKENPVFSKGFIQDIVLAGAIDYPGYFAYMMKDLIKKWGKTEGEIEEQISKNLQKYETKYRAVKENDKILVLGLGGILSTFLLKPKKLREIANENGMEGKELVGILPFRDLIILQEHNVNNAMKLWTTGVNMIHDEIRPYPVSPKPFMIDNDGVVNQFKSDDLPLEGVAVAVNSKTGQIETLSLSKKESDINLPSQEILEELLVKDKRMQEVLSVMVGATRGVPAEEFAKSVLKWAKDKELSKKMIELMVVGDWIKMKRVNDELLVFPAPKTLKLLLSKGR